MRIRKMSSEPQILIVDDEPKAREALARLLSAAGYSCRQSENVIDAIQRMHDQPPDLLLIDYRMPGADGLEMLRQIRNDPNPVISQIPVILMTGYGENEVESLQAGADDFVTKPIDANVLRARIGTQLRLSSMRIELQKQTEEAEARHAELERDLDAARLTQQSLIPQDPPNIPGWEIAACYRPVLQVGGDIYGWLPLKNGRWVFWMADAPGHGAAAALLTTLAKLLFRYASDQSDSPSAILAAMNHDFHGILQSHSFMTAMAVLLDPETGKASVCGAGHPPLLITRFGRGTETVSSSMPPLGLAEGTFTGFDVDLALGDAFVLYTDGLFGGEKTDGLQSTPTQLAAALNPLASNAQMLLGHILAYADQRDQEDARKDDVAVVVVRRKT